MAIASQDSGVGSNVNVPYTNGLVISAFVAIAWYNVAELTVLIQTFFKRYAGFYYFSLLVATWGIFFHDLGTFLKFYHIDEKMAGSSVANTTIAWVGWCMMVTGQSVVLYSRIHLLAQARWTRWILWMIVFNGVTLHSSTGVLTFLTNCAKTPERWIPAYSIMEKIQVTMFFLQEVILSSIYIWKTTLMLKQEGPLFRSKQNVRGSSGREVLMHTIVMSGIIIALDVTLLGLEFAGLYDIQTSFKGAVYSVKLKMEFTILNQLMNLVKGNLREATSSSPYTGPGKNGPLHHYSRHIHGTENSHVAGAYSKMNEDSPDMPIGRPIQLQDLKSTDVLKTTTTEIRVDKISRIDEESEDGMAKDTIVVEGAGRSPSASSSEVYIIESHAKHVV